MSIRIPPGAELITVPETVSLDRGGVLKKPIIAMERLGLIHEPDAPVILVFTGISPDSHIASSAKDTSTGWWEYMVGAGRPVNTDQCQVICINTLGSCYGSTGPASVSSELHQSFGSRYPDITLWDAARVTGLALDQIGIANIECLIGPSMGGMTALAWLLLHPGRTRHMINISATLEAGTFAIALRSLQREIVRSDPGFNNGDYLDGKALRNGMIMARKLGLITYRSASEWSERFGRSRDSVEDGHSQFVIEAYLQINAEKFADSFDPNSYLRLSQAMDWFSVAERFDDPQSEIGKSGLESALVVGVDSDFLFPEQQQQALADCLIASGVKTQYECITSHYGHDAFLIDEENFSPLFKSYLDSIL
ncbi:MAG: homoserine O-acetyltransferase [Thiotrichales bacterium]|nr:homoserine O-acetyltransferase [Thiotrichales bacterium]